MEFAPLREVPPVEELLPSMVRGRIRLAGRADAYLGLVGPERCVTDSFTGQVDTVLARDVLPSDEDAAVSMVRQMTADLAPGGLLILIEQSTPLKRGGKGLIARGLELAGLSHGPEFLTRVMLRAGMWDIRQMWPQGIRSLVVTTGAKPLYQL